MLQNLLKGMLSVIVIKLLDNYRQLSVQLLKIEAAKSYLHVVKIARLSAIGSMWKGLFIACIVLGAILFHAGLFILLPWTLEAKAVLAMSLGLAYMLIGAGLLHTVLRESVWMNKSGATAMLKDALAQKD